MCAALAASRAKNHEADVWHFLIKNPEKKHLKRLGQDS